MRVIGVDELVDASSVFAARGAGVFANTFARGVRNFYDHVTVTVFGVAVMAGVNMMPAPSPRRAQVSFTEPAPSSDDSTWRASVTSLQALIRDMHEGSQPVLAGALSPLVTETLASVRDRKQDIQEWAKGLAADVADLDG
jgi:hypothetical protein